MQTPILGPLRRHFSHHPQKLQDFHFLATFGGERAGFQVSFGPPGLRQVEEKYFLPWRVVSADWLGRVGCQRRTRRESELGRYLGGETRGKNQGEIWSKKRRGAQDDSQTEYTQASTLPNQTDQELSSQLVTTIQGSQNGCTIEQLV